MILENENARTSQADRRSRINQQPIYSGLGKLPPQAVDLEEAVLGAIMIEREGYFAICEIMKPEHFYKESHQRVYAAIQRLFEKKTPVDILTVTAELRATGELEMIGGAYYITELTNRVASAANIEYHARIVFQKFIQRELIRTSSEVINAAYEDTTDVFELMDHNLANMYRLSEFGTAGNGANIGDLADESVESMKKPIPNGITGITTGFKTLDEFTFGWQENHLTIIGARPAMGKTTLMLQLALNAAKSGVPTDIYSLEMSKQQLTNRLLSNMSGVFLEKILKRRLTEYDMKLIDEARYTLKNIPLHIDDTPGLPIMAMRAKCVRAKKTRGTRLNLVDYIQMMQGDVNGKGNRDQELGSISRGLKNIGKELHTSTIALAQLSRDVEKRAGAVKRPQLSDLRESGNIEQDADNVFFIFRPEYYGISKDADGVPTAQLAELICAKHRDGPTDTLKIKFNGALMRFSNLAEEDYAAGQTQVPFVVRGTGDDDLPF